MHACGHDVHIVFALGGPGAVAETWTLGRPRRRFEVRFASITPVHAEPVCTGVVSAVEEGLATVDVRVTLADGAQTVDRSGRGGGGLDHRDRGHALTSAARSTSTAGDVAHELG